MTKIGPETTKVVVMSVGFKHLTYSADAPSKEKRRIRDLCVLIATSQLVVDVSGLPNPHYIDNLRPLTGRDEEVGAYLMQEEETVQLLAYTREQLALLLSGYEKRGNNHGTVTIVFRCTGGKHRSQFFAEKAKLMIEGIVKDWTHPVAVVTRHVRDELGAE